MNHHVKKAARSAYDIIYEIMNYKVKLIYTLVIAIVAVTAAAIVFRGDIASKLGLEQTPPVAKTAQGVILIPGGSPVTPSGIVIAPTGDPAKLDVEPGSSQAPQQSAPLSIKEIPSSAIRLKVTASGFSPSRFTVKAGSVITLAVTSGDNQTHVFAMDNPSLSALAIGLAPGETRAITFNAPRAGTYGFHCGVPGHAARGETGQMTAN